MTQSTDLLFDLRPGAPAPRPPKAPTEMEIIRQWSVNSGKPDISILCHCYEHVSFLKDALNGFLNQRTQFRFEIIIHDDASTDGSKELIQDYTKRYPNIIRSILQKKNQYQLGNQPLMFTLPEAKGRYVAICEGDDYWLDEGKLEKQVGFLEDNPTYVMCCHDAIIVENEMVVSISKLPETLKRNLSALELQRGALILTLTVCFRNRLRSLPEEHRLILNEDKFLFSRLGEYGGVKFMSDIVPGVYRVHEGGVWSSVEENRKRAQKMNSLFWIAQYYRRIGKIELAEDFAEQHVKRSLREIESWSLMRVARLTRSQLDLWLRYRWPRLHRLVSRLNPFGGR